MNTRLLTAGVALLALAGCKPRASSDDTARSIKEIEQVMTAWQKAFEAKDLNGVMATYADRRKLPDRRVPEAGAGQALRTAGQVASKRSP